MDSFTKGSGYINLYTTRSKWPFKIIYKNTWWVPEDCNFPPSFFIPFFQEEQAEPTASQSRWCETTWQGIKVVGEISYFPSPTSLTRWCYYMKWHFNKFFLICLLCCFEVFLISFPFNCFHVEFKCAFQVFCRTTSD